MNSDCERVARRRQTQGNACTSSNPLHLHNLWDSSKVVVNKLSQNQNFGFKDQHAVAYHTVAVEPVKDATMASRRFQ